MTRLTEISQQFADGLITALEFRNMILTELMKIEDEDQLIDLCNLLLPGNEQ